MTAPTPGSVISWSNSRWHVRAVEGGFVTLVRTHEKNSIQREGDSLLLDATLLD